MPTFIHLPDTIKQHFPAAHTFQLSASLHPCPAFFFFLLALLSHLPQSTTFQNKTNDLVQSASHGEGSAYPGPTEGFQPSPGRSLHCRLPRVRLLCLLITQVPYLLLMRRLEFCSTLTTNLFL